MYLWSEKQNKPGSVEDTDYRLGMFFAEVDEAGKGTRAGRRILSSLRAQEPT